MAACGKAHAESAAGAGGEPLSGPDPRFPDDSVSTSEPLPPLPFELALPALVDFSRPMRRNASEDVVIAPGMPAVGAAEDLSDRGSSSGGRESRGRRSANEFIRQHALGATFGNSINRRYLIDSHIGTDPDELNQGLLAVASYNAGPNRIRRLRQEAERRGLDPDVWFANVEQIVSGRIGRETVAHVSHVFKYHIAYRLAEEKAAQRARGRLKGSG